ncbi:DUF3238 domain-containing protein [Paenibacillus chibensis]|uniref:DUF3238 domain-containing protein n=1 Tax=Paenibacillus chibensis TaxID=59846 RepID=UPI000FD919D7|nr:DUF3238 domain-containing protein [Paenibacillus chibensis]MEC0373705.1 DUF3238 domain-containing protein [Paenibacillus chibensis]
MAVNFNIRIVTFIPDAWVLAPYQEEFYSYSYEGDNRSFNPNTANTQNFRTAQQLNVEFNNNGGDYTPYVQTGITNLQRRENLTGKTSILFSGHASTDGLKTSVIQSSIKGETSDYYHFRCTCNIKNPLEYAPAINYDFDIYVHKSGGIQFSGRHDGFPAYEVYAKNALTSNWKTLYQYNPYDHGKSIFDLADGMSQSVTARNVDVLK